MLEHALERLSRSGGQILHLVHVEQGKQPKLRPAVSPVVDDSQTAALAFAAAGIAVAQLAQSPCTLNDVTRCGVLHHCGLQVEKGVVIQVLGPIARERGQFYEQGFYQCT